ncbi:MAG TPA: 3-deoxy-D-manno-octulosonic acid transferase [Acidiferrobacteraceae bacterium]|nr:3-deoxy-D-manno-octulosonic acid transferase [Acidiferrobacteraceae bacterium]
MIRLYSLILYVLLPWLLVRLLWRGLRNPAYWRRWGERFGYQFPDASDVYWVHAVSVGEVRAAVPLINRLLERYPGCRVLVTTMTPTGSDQVGQILADRVVHSYVPYDYPGAVTRFLDHCRPRLVVIMETELWPNLFHACHARSIPLLVANVRLSEKSARGYERFSRLSRSTLEQVGLFGVQSEVDAQRLRRIGAPLMTVRVTGNIKFELQLTASLFEVGEALRRDWGASRNVLLAASTRDGEEEQILKALPDIKKRFADLLLVLVPRHPERFSVVGQLCRKAGYKVVLRSDFKSQALDESAEILIGDTMGELLLFYAAADVAFVGGSLVNTGGHNILEACAVGTPVVFGMSMFNFSEVSQMVIDRSAGMQVKDTGELSTAVIRYLEDPSRRFDAGEAGKKLIEENKGALGRTLALVDELIDT